MEKITAENKTKMNPSDRKINTKNRIYNRSVQIQRGHNKIKATSRKRDPKLNFFIEFKQEYNRSTEVTTLPPSINWKLKIIHGTLLL
jgi:hypothetical protein